MTFVKNQVVHYPVLYIGICLSSVVVIGIVAGCSSGTLEAQVSGRVTLDGTAIGPGTIVFSPVNTGKPATGSIEQDGNYSLKTSREDGLATGSYRVAVSIREMPTNVRRGDRPPPGKLLIPEKYESSTTSGLEYDVSPGSNAIDIELMSQGTGTDSPSGST